MPNFIKRKSFRQKLWKLTSGYVAIVTILNVSMIGAILPIAASTAEAEAWPADNSWVIPVCNDDVANDENPDSVDLKASGSEYGAAYYISNDTLFLRERVNGNPGGGSGGTNWDQYAWVFMIQKDAATTDYDFLVSLRGSGSGENVELWQNTSPAGPIDWSPIFNDPADTQLQTWATANNSRSVATGGDYYVDWQIPLSELTSRGVVINNGKFSTNHGLFWATSTNANNYNKDHLNCYDAPDLRVSKEVSKNGGSYFDDGRQDGVTADPGDSLRYRVTITNVGGPTQGTNTVVDELGKNFNDGDGDAAHNVNPSAQYSDWMTTSNLNSDGNANPFTGAWGDGSADGQSNDTFTLTIPLVSGGGAQEQFTFDASIRNDLAVGSHLLENLATVGQNNSETDVPVVRVGQCILEITKAVDKQTAQPGETLTYTLDYANTGTANCTGGGVRIDDVTPSNTTYVGDSNTQAASNDTDGQGVDFGYDHDIFGSANPSGYNAATKLLSWDAEVVSPGESGTITYQVTVNQLPVCTTTNIDNNAKAYADQVPNGVTSNTVRTTVTTPCNGNLTVSKQYDDDGNGTVDRTNPQGWTWDLQGGSQNNAGGSSLSLAQGQYTVSEDAIANYTSTWSCSDQTSGNDTSFDADVVASEDLVCTFRNTRQTGSVTVNKKVDADGNGSFEGGNAEANALGFDWGLDAETPGRDMGTTQSLVLTGNHSVSEDSVTNYSFVGWYPTGSTQYSCANPQGTTLPVSISVADSQTTSITLCNARDTGLVTVDKEYDDDGNGTVDRTNPQGWTWDLQGGSQNNAGGSSVEVITGNYTLTEDAIADYTSTWSCSDQSSGNGVSIATSISKDEVLTCTFRNTRQTGSVTVSKLLDNDGNGSFETVNPGTFTWSLDGNGAYAMGSTLNLVPTGSHDVNETLPDNYHVVGWYPTGSTQYSCANPQGTTLPVSISVADGQTTSITLCNARDTGTVTVHKYLDTDGDGQVDLTDPQGWYFGIDGGEQQIAMGSSRTLITGPYNVTEEQQTNYHVTNWACYEDQNLIGSGNGETLTVELSTAGAECWFTNTRDTGRIVVIKEVIGGSALPSDWEFAIDGVNGALHSGDAVILPTGDYAIGENGPLDYTLTSVSGICEQTQNGVVVHVTTNGGVCTFTNTRDTGLVTVDKEYDDDGNGTVDRTNPQGWTWDLQGGSQNNAGGSSVEVITGNYTLTEDAIADYTSTWSCSDQSSGNGVSIATSISKDEVLTCTFRNTRQTGTITVHKWFNNDGDEDFDRENPQGWTWDIVNGAQDNAGGSSVQVITGDYTVTEDVDLNYSTWWTCSDQSFGVGTSINTAITTDETLSCTFYNVRNTGTLVVNKVVVQPGQEPIFNPEGWTWQLNDESGIAGGDNRTLLTATAYTVTETPSLYGSDLYTTDWICYDGQIEYASGNGRTFDLNLANPGDQELVCTFTNTRRVGQITGTKFNDLNGDGDWDQGEPGVENVTIHLSNGAVTSTDQAGNYGFSEIPTGDYSVSEDVPSGWVNTTPTAVNVTVTEGQAATANFGNFKLISISGQKFNDLNGDGLKDQGEPGLPNWEICYATPQPDPLINSIQLIPVVTCTTTDQNGNYSFSNLGPNTYTVTEIQQAGWTQTTPNPSDIVAQSGTDVSGIDFGNFELGTISGYKFNDLNGDGDWDEGEPGLANWQINLAGPINDSTTTDGNGWYTFTGLTAGQYTVTETQQTDWVQTTTNPTGIDISSGDEVGGVNFGNFQLFDLEVCKYVDSNGDGQLEGDALYTAEGGWGMTLNHEIGPRYLATENGCAIFPDLGPGSYSLSEDGKDGWIQTYPNGNHAFDGQSGLNRSYAFGNFQLGTISGYKWNDLNGDGDWDEGEPALDGWTIWLDDTTSVVTGTGDWADGYYEFSGLTAGSYTLSEELQNGWTQTAPSDPSTHTVNVGSGTIDQGNNFGNFELGRIEGTKFDALENGLADWTICLDGPDQFHACTTTDANGHYVFENLMVGTYTVSEVAQYGWTQFFPESGTHQVVVTSSTGLTKDSTQYHFGNRLNAFEVEVTKTDSIDPVEAGGLLTYTLNWTVSGNTPVSNVVISDPLPANTSFVSADCGTTLGACVIDSATSTIAWDLGTRTPLDSGSVTVTVLVASPLADGTILENTATICGQAELVGQFDGQPQPTQKCDDGDTSTEVNSDFSVDVTKTDNIDPVQAGQNVTYTVNWSVNGNAPINSLVITDTLPANTTFISASNGGVHNGVIPGFVTWNLGPQAAVANGSLTVTVNVVAPLTNGTVLTDTAEVCAESFTRTEQESILHCDQDDETTTVHSDFTVDITKSDNVDPVTAGQNITYTLTWSLTGNAPINSLVITDTLPANTTFISASNGGVHNGVIPGFVTWNLGPQAAVANGSLTVTIKVASPLQNGTVLTNIGSICAESLSLAQPEILRHCDSDEETTTVTSAPSLSIVKTVSVTTFTNPGTAVTYTVTVTNAASATDTARNVVLTDTLPAGFTFAVDGTTTKSFPIGNLAPGQSATVSYLVNISGSQAAGTYVNLAKAKGDNTNEVTATAPVEVRVPQVLGISTAPELTIIKKVNASTAKPGDVVTYTILVQNIGDGDATNVVVTDTLPKDLSFVHAKSRTMSWELGTLEPGRTREINVDVRVESDAKSGDYVNVAVATSNELAAIQDDAKIVVKRPKVLGLATTGAGMIDLAIGFLGLIFLGLGLNGLRNRRPLKVNRTA